MKPRYIQKNTKKKYGGKVRSSPILEKILSIGFEFETGNMIPVVIDDIDGRYIVTEQTPDKLPSITIMDGIEVDITSDADTPRVSDGVHSSMYEMEQTYMSSDNEPFLDFIDQYINVFSTNDEYNFYNHTEYMFTCLKNSGGFNDNNVIMKYFKFVVDYLMKSFIEQRVIENEEVGRKLKIFSNQSLLYLIPMKFGQDLTPIDIKWVPQMTINVKVVDIISVLEYLSSDLNADSRNGIQDCKFFAYKIIPQQGETLRATRRSQIVDQEEFTEPQKHILDIFRNCVFMLMYLFIYGSTIEGRVLKTIDKNHFDFLFRCSISRIIISLCIKYDKDDIMTCLEYLNNKLLQEEGEQTANIENRKQQRQKPNFLEYYKYNACISFNNFITIFVNRFDNYKAGLLSPEFEIDNVFHEIYQHMKTLNKRELTEDEQIRVQQTPGINLNYFLSTNTFFTEIFQNSSNYYQYNVDNESILIEFRSFGQNLLIEAKDTTKDVYKNLNEWQHIISKIDTVYKTIKPTKSVRKSIKPVRKSKPNSKPNSKPKSASNTNSA